MIELADTVFVDDRVALLNEFEAYVSAGFYGEFITFKKGSLSIHPFT
jgi:hypothetical protein